MFTSTHFGFLAITFILMGIGFFLIFKFKPSFKTVFTVACIGCVISELVKTFSCMEFDWIETYNEAGEIISEELVPYIRMNHVPLHLCSIQILFIFIVRLIKRNKFTDMLVAFMYPTFIVGGVLALLMPSDISFTNPQSYQFFFYHGMLVVLGIYIITQKEIDILPKHYLTTMALLGTFAFMSIYVNSILAHYNYDIVTDTFDLEYITQFFYTMRSPVSFLFTFQEPWHWYLYIVVIVFIALVAIGLLYIPVFVRAKKNKLKSK